VRTVEGDVRLDIVAERNGQRSFFDVKNGLGAGFTPNQTTGYPAVESTGGQFYGQNAANAGLSGQFGAQPVYIIRYP